MTIAAIREKLHEYIDSADDINVVEVFSFIEEDLTERSSNHWEDEAFVTEMNRRFQEFKNGTDKGVSWEEVKRQARELTK
jgi:hypothetical protein